MLGCLIRKEILNHLSDFRFLILAGLGALVIWLSLYSSSADYLERLTDYRIARALTEERKRQIQEGGDLPELIGIGYPEHKPPTALSIFTRGLVPTLGRSAQIQGRGVRTRRSPVTSDLILGVFPPLDLGLIVQAVFSLFVLLLTYDALSGEKEAGTLRLTASFPLPRDRLLLSKLLGAFIPTLAAFGLPLLLGVSVLLLFPEIHFTGPEWARLGWAALTVILYLITFTCAGLLASCLTRRPSTSFVLLLVFWVTTVVVIPRLSLIFADGVHPAPSAYQLQAGKVALDAIHYQKERAKRDAWGEAYRSTHEQEWWRTPEGREAYALKHNELRLERYALTRSEQDRLIENYRNRYSNRLRLAVTLARFSPAFALKNALVRLSGTGLDRQQQFEVALDKHWGRQRIWYAGMRKRDGLRQAKPDQYGEYKWDISDIPRFVYRDTWPQEDIRIALVDTAVLGLWALLFFAGAYVALLRYDFR